MSDALALPPRPNAEQYRRLAKDFQQACKTGDPGAVRNWAVRWAETVARLQERPDTPEVRTKIKLDAERILRRCRKLQKSNEHVEACTLAGAQLLVARCHGFDSWPKFAKHLEAVANENSSVSQFEAAADAIIQGDIATLQKLLRQSPELVRARSTREHRSTLLHYVSANGIEDFRQRTPRNIVQIAKMLLDAGADVNAESDAYGGHSTALNLTATSCHPEAAGVQLNLLDLLIERGALIDGPDGSSTVNACLHNGRGQAAEFLAKRGARLDLEGAAGVGRLEIVRSFFNDDKSLKPPATQQQLIDGFMWACEFGRTSVVEFLLKKDVPLDFRSKGGATGLHWAAYEGNADIVGLLLERGAPVDIRDESYDGSPLGWALYGWRNCTRPARRGKYYEAVALLIRAGAKVDSEWFETGDEERQRAAREMRSDRRMQAALRGETPQRT